MRGYARILNRMWGRSLTAFYISHIRSNYKKPITHTHHFPKTITYTDYISKKHGGTSHNWHGASPMLYKPNPLLV